MNNGKKNNVVLILGGVTFLFDIFFMGMPFLYCIFVFIFLVFYLKNKYYLNTCVLIGTFFIYFLICQVQVLLFNYRVNFISDRVIYFFHEKNRWPDNIEELELSKFYVRGTIVITGSFHIAMDKNGDPYIHWFMRPDVLWGKTYNCFHIKKKEFANSYRRIYGCENSKTHDAFHGLSSGGNGL